MLQEFDLQRKDHPLCGRPVQEGSRLAELHDNLRRCVKDPSSLTSRDVGRIRLILACFVDKRGSPGSRQCREMRQRQVAAVAGPTHDVFRKVVLGRLDGHPKDGGIEDISTLTRPVTDEEQREYVVRAGTPIPPTILAKAEKCLSGTVDALIQRGIIPSSELLSRILPAFTSGIAASGFADPSLRELYAAIYRAFRRRRSLLLLDLQTQVGLRELPWVAAVESLRQDAASTPEPARRSLEEVAILALASFPTAIVPNRLLTELRSLVKDAGLDIPLVNELAADIFMGQFTNAFVRAAKVAADILEGTLYPTYYGIDYRLIRGIPEAAALERQARPAINDRFAQLCAARAGVPLGTWEPAANGMIIEQQQILTTQNLAALVAGLDLQESLCGWAVEISQRCFRWICRRQQMKICTYHAQLIMLKNTAYAWRQMVFFLSLVPPAELQAFLLWADEHLGEQKVSFQARLRPVLDALRATASGQPVMDGDSRGPTPFLGWARERHWLLA